MDVQEDHMSTENRQLAAQFLRSGDYQQGTGHYHKNGCHCALGVVFEAMGCAWSCEVTATGNKPLLNGERQTAVEAYEWLGIRIRDLDVSIALMNDQGATFNEIATFFETYQEPT